MNNNPLKIPEIVEIIVGNLEDEELFIISKLGGIWYKIARYEAYERWKKYANAFDYTYRQAQAIRENQGINEIGWLEAVCKVEDLYSWMDIITENQVNIMKNMLENEMIVDPKEKEIIRKVIIQRNWGVDFIQIHLTIRMGME